MSSPLTHVEEQDLPDKLSSFYPSFDGCPDYTSAGHLLDLELGGGGVLCHELEETPANILPMPLSIRFDEVDIRWPYRDEDASATLLMDRFNFGPIDGIPLDEQEDDDTNIDLHDQVISPRRVTAASRRKESILKKKSSITPRDSDRHVSIDPSVRASISGNGDNDRDDVNEQKIDESEMTMEEMIELEADATLAGEYTILRASPNVPTPRHINNNTVMMQQTTMSMGDPSHTGHQRRTSASISESALTSVTENVEEAIIGESQLATMPPIVLPMSTMEVNWSNDRRYVMGNPGARRPIPREIVVRKDLALTPFEAMRMLREDDGRRLATLLAMLPTAESDMHDVIEGEDPPEQTVVISAPISPHPIGDADTSTIDNDMKAEEERQRQLHEQRRADALFQRDLMTRLTAIWDALGYSPDLRLHMIHKYSTSKYAPLLMPVIGDIEMIVPIIKQREAMIASIWQHELEHANLRLVTRMSPTDIARDHGKRSQMITSVDGISDQITSLCQQLATRYDHIMYYFGANYIDKMTQEKRLLTELSTASLRNPSQLAMLHALSPDRILEADSMAASSSIHQRPPIPGEFLSLRHQEQLIDDIGPHVILDDNAKSKLTSMLHKQLPYQHMHTSSDAEMIENDEQSNAHNDDNIQMKDVPSLPSSRAPSTASNRHRWSSSSSPMETPRETRPSSAISLPLPSFIVRPLASYGSKDKAGSASSTAAASLSESPSITPRVDHHYNGLYAHLHPHLSANFIIPPDIALDSTRSHTSHNSDNMRNDNDRSIRPASAVAALRRAQPQLHDVPTQDDALPMAASARHYQQTIRPQSAIHVRRIRQQSSPNELAIAGSTRGPTSSITSSSRLASRPISASTPATTATSALSSRASSRQQATPTRHHRHNSSTSLASSSSSTVNRRPSSAIAASGGKTVSFASGIASLPLSSLMPSATATQSSAAGVGLVPHPPSKPSRPQSAHHSRTTTTSHSLRPSSALTSTSANTHR
jgi:hypothetical protein